MTSKRSIDPSTAIVVLAVLVAVIHFVTLLRDPTSLFVHPDYYRYILPESTRSGLGIGVDDLINSLQLRSPGEFRPRFVAYLIQALDIKIRLAFYPLTIVHPTIAPIAWFFQVVVAMAALYRLIVNLTGDRTAALGSLAVYATATGFLSGFTMQLLQGKVLSNVIWIVSLWLVSEGARHLKPGQLLVQAPWPIKLCLPIVLFVGLFLDELPVFTFVLVPLVFASLFLRWPRRFVDLASLTLNGVYFAAPAVAFLAFVIFVVPPLTERFFDFRFDYLGNTLAIGENRRGATSFLEGPHATLTPAIIMDNFMTLTGMSLADWRTSPLIKSEYGDYPGSQENNLPKIATMVAFFGTAIWLALSLRGQLAWYLRGTLAAFAVFIVFLSLLLIRHLPVATGYYYGSTFAVVMAVLVGLLVKGITVSAPRLRLVAVLAILAIVVIQIDNFAQVNAGWIRTHYEALTRPTFGRILTVKPGNAYDGRERPAIWQAWLAGQLNAYVDREGVPVDSVYLVYDLRTIDRRGVRELAPAARPMYMERR